MTQHRAAARRSSPPHDDPSQTGLAPRHGAGIRPPEGGGMFRAAIYERDWRRPSCIARRSSSSSVASSQWCVHCDARDNHRRLVAIKTPFARLAKSRRTARPSYWPLKSGAKSLNCTLSPNIWLANWSPSDLACHPSTHIYIYRRPSQKARPFCLISLGYFEY